MPTIGHNSGDDTISGAAQTRLRSFLERIERLEEDKAGIAADIKDVYAEMKGEGVRHQGHAQGGRRAQERPGQARRVPNDL